MRRFSLVYCLFVLLVTISVSEASMVKGSAGKKTYSYIPDRSGHAHLSLIYDNRSADLDVAIGFVSTNGEAFLVGTGLATVSNYERVECGVSSSIVYGVVVNSYRGSSPFRLTVATSGDELLLPANLQFPQMPNRGILIEQKTFDKNTNKVLELFNKTQRYMKILQ
jgi:hypothetical protein